MKILTQHIEIETQGNFDVVDITETAQDKLRSSLLQEGMVTIFNPSSTGGFATIEHEECLKEDIEKIFKNLIPDNHDYGHDKRWHDGNGHAHWRSSFLKTSLTVPFSHGLLLLGVWQQIVFVEFDNRPRKRKIVLQFMGL